MRIVGTHFIRIWWSDFIIKISINTSKHLESSPAEKAFSIAVKAQFVNLPTRLFVRTSWPGFYLIAILSIDKIIFWKYCFENNHWPLNSISSVSIELSGKFQKLFQIIQTFLGFELVLRAEWCFHAILSLPERFDMKNRNNFKPFGWFQFDAS